MTAPLVTAMVSTYASERYLRGCLDDLLAQSARDLLEIVVVDAASPEREGELVRAYQQRHANLRYVRTERRETTSQAFRRATAMARGRYLTTANTDDRHHPEFVARTLAVLEQCPQVGLVYADSAISTVDNETWTTTGATRRFRWPDYTPATALSCCLFGAQPVWRNDLHARAGDWSDAFAIANDHDLFARVARAGGAVRIDDVLGLFLQRPDSNAGSGRAAAVLADACAVMQQLRRLWPLDEIVPGARSHGPLAEAAAWFELGNVCALGPYTDAAAALDCYRAAVSLPLQGAAAALVRDAYATNVACVLVCGGVWEAARRALRHVDNVAAHARIAAAIAAGSRGGLPRLRDLPFARVAHEVVDHSRRTRSVRVDERGALHWNTEHEQVPWDVFDGPNGVPWQRPAAIAAGVPVVTGS
jgi:hypothetical protein